MKGVINLSYPSREEILELRREQQQIDEIAEELFGISEEMPRMTDDEFLDYVEHNVTDNQF